MRNWVFFFNVMQLAMPARQGPLRVGVLITWIQSKENFSSEARPVQSRPPPRRGRSPSPHRDHKQLLHACPGPGWGLTDRFGGTQLRFDFVRVLLALPREILETKGPVKDHRVGLGLVNNRKNYSPKIYSKYWLLILQSGKSFDT